MKAQEYHEDLDLHGSYQYVLLSKIIDDFVYETLDDDSIFKNTRRTKIIKHAKDALLELNKSTFNEKKVIEITVPEHLFVTLPHDFVALRRLSVVVFDTVTSSNRLKVLDVNSNINIGEGYLQDHKWKLLFDDQGNILTADAQNAYNKPYKEYQFQKGGDATQISRNGEYVIDKNRGQILFSSNLYDHEIVLEYRSDGLQFDTYGEDKIEVHKDMIEVLKDRMYYTLIRYKRHVPQNKIEMALRRFKTTRHEAKLNQLNFNITEVFRNARNANY